MSLYNQLYRTISTILALFENAVSPLSNKANIVKNGSVQPIIRRLIDKDHHECDSYRGSKIR